MTANTTKLAQSIASVYSVPTSWDGVKKLQVDTTQMLRERAVRLARNKYSAKHGRIDPTQTDQWFLEQATPPALQTQKTYLGVGKKLFNRAMASGIDVWAVLEERSNSGGSWNAGKVALQFFLAAEMRLMKRHIDELMRNASPGSAYAKPLATLVALANALAAIPVGKPAKFLAGSGFKQVRKSKSHSARHADANWRERVAEALDKKYQAAWLIQCITGCRPQELANGVKLVLQPNGVLAFRVMGAKLTKRSGQQWRDLNLSVEEAGLVKMLAGKLRVGQRLHFQMSHKVNTYCRALSRCCKKLFPSDDPNKLLSAYSARHQRKADWKAAGMSRVELAKALGHRSTRSAAYYGRRVKGRSSAVRPLAVQAAETVKVRSHPVRLKASTRQWFAASEVSAGMRPR